MSDSFTRSIARIVVGQVLEGVEAQIDSPLNQRKELLHFTAAQRSAVSTLSDILLRYISEIGKAAHGYAELACRVECNLNDILLAFEDVGISLPEIMRFVKVEDEVPFPRPLPPFQMRKKPKFLPQTFVEKAEAPPHADIPDWLPAFPDRHTYICTPVFQERKVDPQVERVEQAKEVRRAERSLVALHRHTTAGSNMDGAGPSHPHARWEDKAEHAAIKEAAAVQRRSTPAVDAFVSAPLLHGEREVAAIEPPRTPCEGDLPVIPGQEASSLEGALFGLIEATKRVEDVPEKDNSETLKSLSGRGLDEGSEGTRGEDTKASSSGAWVELAQGGPAMKSGGDKPAGVMFGFRGKTLAKGMAAQKGLFGRRLAKMERGKKGLGQAGGDEREQKRLRAEQILDSAEREAKEREERMAEDVSPQVVAGAVEVI